jgi:hypothetical protein
MNNGGVVTTPLYNFFLQLQLLSPLSHLRLGLQFLYNLFRLIFLKNYAIISTVKEGLVPLVTKKEQLMNKNPSIVSMAVTAKNFVGGG